MAANREFMYIGDINICPICHRLRDIQSKIAMTMTIFKFDLVNVWNLDRQEQRWKWQGTFLLLQLSLHLRGF